MTPGLSSSAATSGATARIEHGLQFLAAYLVPALAALLSVWALWSWSDEYPVDEGRTLTFTAMTVDTPRSPAQAVESLSRQPPRTLRDTRLSEYPL